MSNTYIKKPIAVRAIQWNGPEDNEKILPIIVYSVKEIWCIKTLEGWLNLTKGSYVVGPGLKGEYWPVDREIFEQTYQKVD